MVKKQKEDKPVNDKQIEVIERLLGDLNREDEYNLKEIKEKWTLADAAELVGYLIIEKYGG